MRHGVVRIELEGPAISIDCRFKPVQVLQDIAEIAVCSGKIRFEAERPAKMVFRPFKLAQFAQGIAEVRVSLG